MEFNGSIIKVILSNVSNKREKTTPKHEGKKRKIKKDKHGILNVESLNYLEAGWEFFRTLTSRQFDKMEAENGIGIESKSVGKNVLIQLRRVIAEAQNTVSMCLIHEKEYHQRIDNLRESTKIAQAARDGIIVEKTVDENGKVYDTTMTEQEIQKLLEEYEQQLDQMYGKRVECYLGIGLAVMQIMGTMVKEKETGKIQQNLMFLGVSTISEMLANKIDEIVNRGSEERQQERRNLRNELFINKRGIFKEPVSQSDVNLKIEKYEEGCYKYKKMSTTDRIREGEIMIVKKLLGIMVTGGYIYKTVDTDSGRLNGRSLAQSLMNIGQYDVGMSSLKWNIKKMMEYDETDFDKISEQVNNILAQMDEKVYSLRGAEGDFDSFKIENLNAGFYPKTNYDTGEIEYGTTLQIDEFSVKKGETVLITGESGCGKSTFLRLIKRGDIGSRNCITLNTGEKVDFLGPKVVSFRPNMELDTNSKVIEQITGKRSFSSLTKGEQQSLLYILENLGWNKNSIEYLSNKKYNEFSTGQQKRLNIAKMFFYVSKEHPTVIIADEPANNVEERLVKKQFEMLQQYCRKMNSMLILVSHRIDIAQAFANRMYRINNGVMEELKRDDKQQSKDDENMER